MSDDDRVQLHIDMAELEGREISDACARVIASWWADGMGPGQVFASTGAITGPDAVWHDLTNNGTLYTLAGQAHRRALDWLATYLHEHGQRDSQPGWSDMWLGAAYMCPVSECTYETSNAAALGIHCARHTREDGE